MKLLESVGYKKYYRLDQEDKKSPIVVIYDTWENMDSVENFSKDLHKLTQGKYIRLYPGNFIELPNDYDIDSARVIDTIDLCIKIPNKQRSLLMFEFSIGLFEYETFEELEIKCKELIRKIYPAIKKNRIGGIKVL